MFKQLKAWYLKTFLPFEDPSHPLYSDGSVPNCNGSYDDEMLQEISHRVDAEVASWEDAPYQAEYTVSSAPETTNRI